MTDREYEMVRVKDLNLSLLRPRDEKSKLKNRTFSSEEDKQRTVEDCLRYTYYTAIVSHVLSVVCLLQILITHQFICALLQHISLVNDSNEVVKSEYMQTDGVDSTRFALDNLKGCVKVRIRIVRRDIVRSLDEYNAKLQGTTWDIIISNGYVKSNISAMRY